MGLPSLGEIWDKARGYVEDKIEDAKEVYELHDDFKQIMDVQDYFSEHQEELEDTGIWDVLSDTEGVRQKIKNADQQIVKALEATREIQNTELRFSKEYLRENVDELEEALDSLDGISTNLLHYIADPDSNIGGVGRFLLPKSKEREIADLSLALKSIQQNIAELTRQLELLIDYRLETDSNNKLLNPYLGGKEYYDDTKESYNRFKEVYEALQKLKRMKDRVDDILN